MRTEVLKQLIEVDKERSISKAAQNLFISKSTLSENISQLEQELNCPIFIRNKKEITTSEAGKKIIQQSRLILSEIEKLYSISLDSPPLIAYRETLRFGLNAKFPKTGLNNCLSIMMKKYPKINLHSSFLNLPKCINALVNDEIDFAIIAYAEDRNDITMKLLKQNSLSYQPLHYDPVICVFNKDSFPAINKTYVSYQEIHTYTLITYSDLTPEESYLNEHEVLYFTDLDNIVQLINDNVGISLLPYSLVKTLSPSQCQNISTIPLHNIKQYNGIIYSSLKPLTQAQKYFINLYQRTFEKNFDDYPFF